MPGILSDITGGGAFAIVPADALADCTLSRDARWLYSLLCGHADRTGLCRRSLRRLADEQGVSRRSLQRWLGELEECGRVVRVNAEGKAGQFRVIRNPADLPTSRAIGVARTDERRVRYGEYGRVAAFPPAMELVTVLSPVRLWIKRQGVTALSPERCQGRHRYP
ncbi:helix-turn-helix domain-containing protein [Azospirillum argentinense]